MSIGGKERIIWKQKYVFISCTSLCSNKAVCIATDDGHFTLLEASNQESAFAEGRPCFVFKYLILTSIESSY